MPLRAAGGSPESAYAPHYSKYLIRPGTVHVLDHSCFCNIIVAFGSSGRKELSPAGYISNFSQLPDDGIPLAKQSMDSSTVDHLVGWLLDGPWKTAGLKLCLEFVLPHRVAKPAECWRRTGWLFSAGR
jgi:hypothetical protein